MMHKRLAAPEYRDILKAHLVPMFTGSALSPSPLPCPLEQPMILAEKPGSLLVRPDDKWGSCFRLTRAYPFDDGDQAIASSYVRSLNSTLVASNEPFFDYLLDKCPEDVVVARVGDRRIDDSLLPDVVKTLRKWASQTYEGARISVSIGVDPIPAPDRVSNIHFLDIAGTDIAKVLSNGLDTLFILAPSGHVVDLLSIAENAVGRASLQTSQSFSPHRYLPLADWAIGSRVALILNRWGEILVFKKRRLVFAFRRGTWFHFGHEAALARMGAIRDGLRRAIYDTCLDISFARTGGCISVGRKGSVKNPEDIVDEMDLLSRRDTSKSALLDHLIGVRFDKIPRRLREELAALDGAVVLRWDGIVLAAGAIVRVSAGSEGGGRRAAAKALARYGLAVDPDREHVSRR